MPEFDNDLRGVLFKNTDKVADNHPDYRGQAEIDRVQYWVDAWIKTSGAKSKTPGAKFLSLSFKPKRASEHRGGAANPAPQQSTQNFDDDEIPF
jgi:hypothetical protein